jgi:putative Mg2+ transporter-C (MgtC) family protein
MIDWREILVRLTMASVFGAIIGLERERKDWAAGLRTHMLVCLGSSLVMLVSAYGFSDVLNNRQVVLDPSRIAAQVISGIGFIGAGTILFLKQGVIRGLTTASGLWTVAAIGLATGGGMYFAAGVTTLLALIILWILKPIESRVTGKFKQKKLQVSVTGKNNTADLIHAIFQTGSIHVTDFSVENKGDDFTVIFKIKNTSESVVSEMIQELHSAAGVQVLKWNE